jgi:hypothetical protein
MLESRLAPKTAPYAGTLTITFVETGQLPTSSGVVLPSAG